MSRTAKNKRLVEWLSEVMMTQLKKIIAQRDSCATFSGLLNPDKVIQKERMVVDEVAEALAIPSLMKVLARCVVTPKYCLLVAAKRKQYRSHGSTRKHDMK
jgi:hypothetical protein